MMIIEEDRLTRAQHNAIAVAKRTNNSMSNPAFADPDYERTFNDTLNDLKAILDGDPQYISSEDKSRPYKSIKYVHVTAVEKLRVDNMLAALGDDLNDIGGIKISSKRTNDGRGLIVNIYAIQD